MRIGITCYPTYGGSGVVATELGIELAALGHEIHFISYSQPFRLSGRDEGIFYHEVPVSNYPLFEFPPYDLALASRMAEVAEYYNLDLLHVHYAIPHSVSALLARQMLAAKGRRLPFVTTLHGTDITLVGLDRSYLPITRHAIQESDGVTSISVWSRIRGAPLAYFRSGCVGKRRAMGSGPQAACKSQGFESSDDRLGSCASRRLHKLDARKAPRRSGARTVAC